MDWQVGAGFIGNGSDPRTALDHTMIVLFRYEPVEVKSKSTEGIPCFEEREFIEIRTPGEREAVYNGPVKEDHKKRWADKYKAWKETGQTPRVGLPLEQWAQLSRARVMELKSVGIHTVEELANVQDSFLTRLGLYGAQTRQKAKDYLDFAKGGAVVNNLRDENDKLKSQLEFLTKRVAFLEESAKEAPAPAQAAPIDISAMVAKAVADAIAAAPTKQTKKVKNEKAA